MSEGVEQSQVAMLASTAPSEGLLVESKVEEINEKNLSLDALKCAIEAIGDAMSELAETSAGVHKKEVAEEPKEDEPEPLKEVSTQPQASSNIELEANDSADSSAVAVDAPDQPKEEQSEDVPSEIDRPAEEVPVVVLVVEKIEDVPSEIDKPVEEVPVVVLIVEKVSPEAQSSSERVMDSEAAVMEEKDVDVESKLGEDMSESGFENALSEAMSVKKEEDGAQTEVPVMVVAIQNLDGSAVQLADLEHRLSIDTNSMSTSEYEEIEVEIEVDDDEETSSQITAEGEEKPKKKKKLRIMKKIKRAPGRLAYGALFSVGALVGGTLVGGQVIGHGVVDGSKAVGLGAKSGAGFVADTSVKFAEGTKDIAKKSANKVAEGAKAGGDFVVETGGKIVDGTKETAVNFAKATSGAVTDSANAALYSVGAVVGGTLAVGQGVGHGALAIGHGVVGGTKAIGHGMVDGTKAIGHGVADGTKAGAKFIADTANKAADQIEEKARQTLVAAVEATQAGAQYAGYGKQQGVPLAIEGVGKSQKKN